jgi:hypothetical protein
MSENDGVSAAELQSALRTIMHSIWQSTRQATETRRGISGDMEIIFRRGERVSLLRRGFSRGWMFPTRLSAGHFRHSSLR